MHLTIECLSGSLAGKQFRFDQPQITLGRGEQQKKDIDFADTDTTVSREHGLFLIREEQVFFTDQSRGGTFTPRGKLQGTTMELQSGDELRLGGKNGPILRVLFHAPTPAQPPRVPLPTPPAARAQDATVLQMPDFQPPAAMAGGSAAPEATVFQSGVPTYSSQNPPSDATYFQSGPPPDATYFQSGAQPPADATYFQGGPLSGGPSPTDATYFQGGPPPAPADATYFQPSNSAQPAWNPASSDQTYVQPQTLDSDRSPAPVNPPKTASIPSKRWLLLIPALLIVGGGVWFFFLR
ncbi:FHA domain-containing protein [Anthocerotibacter panamensis]|uniref:FHA domain-containing protein n=1 Tax=Anthocerotibacter panamensis TaxID=2857077 RepID=UPI001C403A10|nr:FHA domain-containing protein [Anthocerotibacter panamensis]